MHHQHVFGDGIRVHHARNVVMVKGFNTCAYDMFFYTVKIPQTIAQARAKVLFLLQSRVCPIYFYFFDDYFARAITAR